MPDAIPTPTSIKLKLLDNAKDLPLPEYATDHSAGMDIVAAIDEDMTIEPMQRVMVPTGLSVALPAGFEMQIRPRSGLAAKHGITVLNTPGTVDADYRGEIKIILINLSDTDFKIERGMRIAQMVITEYTRTQWTLVDELDETERGTGGFGSTGTK